MGGVTLSANADRETLIMTSAIDRLMVRTTASCTALFAGLFSHSILKQVLGF